MTSRDFVYWLQGYAELSESAPTTEQWESIKRHLALVFKHEIDPSMGDEKHQAELNESHAAPPRPPFKQQPSGKNLIRC
jgi:hypothetical protein